MFKRFTLLLTLLCLLSTKALRSQPFPCDGSLLLSTNSGSGFTNINKVTFGPFGAVNFGSVNRYPGGNFNGLGFNPEDNYIYAVKSNSNEIVRLRADNSFEVIGNVPAVDKLATTAGECTPDGYYLCHDQNLDQILVFEVVDNFALINQVDLFWDPDSENSGRVTARIDDFAIDPTDPTVAYSYQGDYFDADLDPEETRGYLLRINLDFQSPELGKVTPVGQIATDEIRKIGGLFFLTGGALFGYGTDARDANASQNQLVRIDKMTAAVNKYTARGPGAVFPDGCSCPYNLSFTNVVNPNFALCTDDEVTYTLTVNNQTFQDIPGASILDTLPEGMQIANITGNFRGNLVTGTGIGTRILQLDEVIIPAKSVLTINLEAEIIDLPIDFVNSQAHLTNLPEKFRGDMVSDDPSTSGFVGDATRIFADPQRLNAFSAEVAHPTDCLQPADGQIEMSASVFIPNVAYEVKMRNEKFEEFSRTVIADNQRSFLLDSLLPGAYTFYQITPNDSQCSFAMKDTTITLDAPDAFLRAELSTNAPVCEGESLLLSATVFPSEGTVEWTGPAFYSTELDTILREITADKSGSYEMVFSYGICEQVRELEVLVNPIIEATISGPLEYCERDTIRLTAEGAGNLTSFAWSTPNGESIEQVLEIPTATVSDEGDYELIVDNGACSDTVRQFIELLPTPTLSLPYAEQSKFCDPVVLTPTISGATNLSYNWTPSEGLSCVDCPNPTIAQPINFYHQLTVSNEFGCRDSAGVFVFLEQEDLIYTPNIFSPNGDGQNDYFQLFQGCAVASINSLQIFHRFGNLVFNLEDVQEFSDPTLFWDGTFGGRAANEGVYVWQAMVTLIDGSSSRLQGTVTLVR
ncbi:MAG: gliding motility-associated C-terminal domain-containing protein [Bacteroidota bacterium]